MLGREEKDTPVSRKDWSYDFRLLYRFHVCMVLLLCLVVLTHGVNLVSVEFQCAVTGGLFLYLAFLSVRHRLRTNWHWPGARRRNWLWATAVLGMGIYLFVACTPISIFDVLFPLLAMIQALTIFGALLCLSLASLSEATLREQCGETREPEEERAGEHIDPAWHGIVRACVYVAVILGLTVAITSFYCFNLAFRDGSNAPTATQTESLNNHGTIVYVTPKERRTVSILETCAPIGLFSPIGIALFCRFVLGVRIFRFLGAPVLREMLRV